MAVRESCRHYQSQSRPNGERTERCRVGANTQLPFSCPNDCLFFERRAISSAGWQVAPERRPDGAADG